MIVAQCLPTKYIVWHYWLYYILCREKLCYISVPNENTLNSYNIIRIYHNDTLQTKSYHREEEPQNTDSHQTPGRQFK